jgi:hypothetical protein
MVTITHLALDSDAVSKIIEAYDAAWERLKGSIFVSTRRTQETRAIIVQAIIEMAERGERDPSHLCTGALRRFGMS